MTKAILLSFTGLAAPDREAEFDEWFDKVHLPEVCGTPGIVSARRFHVSKVQRPALKGELPKNLAMYEFETDDVQATMDALDARVKTGDISKPPEGLLKPNMDYEGSIFEVVFEFGT
jgi:hypothetical protein